MSWRSILISQPARLSLQNRQLLIEQGEGEAILVPLEDIAALVLETPQATITSALLAAMAEADIAVLTCGETHHPNGVLLPFLPHSRQVAVLRRQLAMSEPQKKRTWQRIVQAKLNNQAAILERAQVEAGARHLRALAADVKSGDPENLEGQGARRYFLDLFGDGFQRERKIWQNAALNYGYAILRAALARATVRYGFLPALGVHHDSELNAFNLVDDLIEPFRPLVDDWVRQQIVPGSTMLAPKHKAALAYLLYVDVRMPQGVMNVLAAVDQVVESFGRVGTEGEARLLALPTL